MNASGGHRTFRAKYGGFGPESHCGSITCKNAGCEKFAEPLSLTASGSSRDYRQIWHDSDDYPIKRIQYFALYIISAIIKI
ncbi:hypothetical protein PQR57_29730 [Paraburkholderia dipogonis]|uniref:Uncharacterized protein n=1 Tax=Paraburkholderia dipogonis TaxID=1211383 RepID=A0ABW9AYY5_9BURK